MIHGFKDLPYEERLQRLNLTTLEERRARGDKIQCFKILKGLDDLDPAKFFDQHLDNRTRGHILKLRKHHSRLDSRKFFFSNRVVDSFNAISPRAALCNTVLDFKKLLSNGERAIARH
jgi:hypothetical protein